MTTNSTGLPPQECVRLLIKYRFRWLVPTAICAVLATGYALVMSRYWEASQAMVVRNEVSTPSEGQPGEFSDLYEMRTFQETILELAKSRHVLAETIRNVESTTDNPNQQPTTKEINKLRKHISLLPPHGAEFGKTEVFYLRVKDKSRERSLLLVNELCHQLDVRMRDLREEQSQSVVVELEMQTELAEAAHRMELAKLELFETEIGSDLGELRMLHAASSGQSDLRQQVVSLEEEHRKSQSQVREAEQLLTVLRSAQNSPEALIAMPSSLLVSQPTLRSLKEGLVESQLRAARLTGTRTAEHPRALAAVKAVERIGNDLHRELQVAIEGVKVELDLNRDHNEAIGSELAELKRRLTTLAENRAEYTNRVAAVESSHEALAISQKKLSEVRAVQVAARKTSLVTPIDKAEVGEHPVGITRASVVMVGTIGGLILGLGCLFITMPPTLTDPYAVAAAIAKSRAQPEVKQPNITSSQEESNSPASDTLATKTSASEPTITEVVNSPLPIYEEFEQHLALADDLTKA